MKIVKHFLVKVYDFQSVYIICSSGFIIQSNYWFMIDRNSDPLNTFQSKYWLSKYATLEKYNTIRRNIEKLSW